MIGDSSSKGSVNPKRSQVSVREPTLKQVRVARKIFESNEPRDLFYHAATALVDLSIHQRISLSVSEAIAVLLQTWNAMYYRFRDFDSRHFSEIEAVLDIHRPTLIRVRNRSIETLKDSDRDSIQRLFRGFEVVLGPVGAAKCLHLMAPRFFPLWDRTIAAAYGFHLRPIGQNAGGYWGFMQTARKQVEGLGGERRIARNPLKALDEYNYCRHTKHWI